MFDKRVSFISISILKKRVFKRSVCLLFSAHQFSTRIREACLYVCKYLIKLTLLLVIICPVCNAQELDRKAKGFLKHGFLLNAMPPSQIAHLEKFRYQSDADVTLDAVRIEHCLYKITKKDDYLNALARQARHRDLEVRSYVIKALTTVEKLDQPFVDNLRECLSTENKELRVCACDIILHHDQNLQKRIDTAHTQLLVRDHPAMQKMAASWLPCIIEDATASDKIELVQKCTEIIKQDDPGIHFGFAMGLLSTKGPNAVNKELADFLLNRQTVLDGQTELLILYLYQHYQQSDRIAEVKTYFNAGTQQQLFLLDIMKTRTKSTLCLKEDCLRLIRNYKRNPEDVMVALLNTLFVCKEKPDFVEPIKRIDSRNLSKKSAFYTWQWHAKK